MIPLHERFGPIALPGRHRVLDRHDERRVARDPRLAVDQVRELAERAQAVLRTRLRHVVLEALALLALPLRRPARGDVLDVEPGVPELHRAHAGEARHRVAVRARDREVDRVALLVVESAVASGDGEACDEPLDVPLERPRKRLVEVVDAEDHPPVRCGEDAEVRQVRVAAQLDVQPGARLVREVRSHDGGGASVEGERRHEHAAVADGHELLEARLRLVLQQLDGSRRLASGLHSP